MNISKFKYINLLNTETVEEFDLQCVFVSYASMTIKQNIDFINELFKYSEYIIYQTNNNVLQYNSNFKYTNNNISFILPVGFKTICDTVLNSTKLDDLIKNSKFQKHIILILKSNISVIRWHLAYIFLMHMFKKFPDMHKLQFNIRKSTNTCNFTLTDVQYFFEHMLKKQI